MQFKGCNVPWNKYRWLNTWFEENQDNVSCSYTTYDYSGAHASVYEDKKEKHDLEYKIFV